jgi:hypothetical protein
MFLSGGAVVCVSSSNVAGIGDFIERAVGGDLRVVRFCIGLGEPPGGATRIVNSLLVPERVAM